MRKTIQVITMPWSCFSDHIVYFYYKHCRLFLLQTLSSLKGLSFIGLLLLTGKGRFKTLWIPLKFQIRIVKIPLRPWETLFNISWLLVSDDAL